MWPSAEARCVFPTDGAWSPRGMNISVRPPRVVRHDPSPGRVALVVDQVTEQAALLVSLRRRQRWGNYTGYSWPHLPARPGSTRLRPGSIPVSSGPTAQPADQLVWPGTSPSLRL
jgi:hypothetical protein